MHFPTPKKLIAGGGLTAALLGAFLMGGVALHQVGAAPPATPGTPTTVVRGEPPETNEASEPALNPAQVKVTADQARAAALAKFPGATVKRVELQDENGTLVWGVELTDASGAAQDVKVDGASGQVLSVEADGPDGAEGAETPGN
jgi:hypothetical protein